MAKHVDVMIAIPEAQEKATVQTRSFSSQLLAAQAMSFVAARDTAGLAALQALPELASQWLTRVDEVIRPLAPSFQRAYILGSGERWGLALEGALKLKETSLTEAEGFQVLEFRHGPMSMVDRDTLIVGLLGETNARAEAAVLKEMKDLGGQILLIGEEVDSHLGGGSALSFISGLPERSRLPLYLPPLQLLAFHRGYNKGLDPDHPRHLSFAVELERL